MTNLPIAINHSGHVLVASPSPVVRERVLRRLNSPARVAQASGGAEALGRLETGPWQTLFLDRHLPDLDAEELTNTIHQRFPTVEVVMLEDEVAQEAESGYADSSIVESDCDTSVHESACDTASAVAFAPLPGMIGHSRAMSSVYRAARLVARRDTTVLITGPTGSGKELVARAIHALSPRASRPFVVVNCAAIPESLLESELFGHVRGAFTGAMQSYSGRIQSAQGGTLLLDEIGEMPLCLQPKLLRFLEQKEIQRLGSCDAVRIDARVIAATNVYLPGLVDAGKFREDLYYRLNAFPIEIPPLRQRPEDVVALVRHLLEKLSPAHAFAKVSVEALQLLKLHSWPGNVRELQNTIERAVILAEGGSTLRPEHLLLHKPAYVS